MEIQLDNLSLPASTEGIHQTNGGVIIHAPVLTIKNPIKPLSYLYSGWQSWSLTTWVDVNRKVLPARPSMMHPMQTDPLYARETRPHGSWYGAVKYPGEDILFLGALNMESHVILDDFNLTGRYESGSGDWFLAIGKEISILEHYAELLSEHLGTGRKVPSLKIWCSWYSLYTEINENNLLKILHDLGKMPFDVFQVDDGWQKEIGDWEPNRKFPSGMGDLAARIQSTGRTPGLWLAPLLASPSSSLFKEHRDWLLHDDKGELVSAGFNWGKPLFALDTTHPESLEWLDGLMRKVRAWGYAYAKLDFLYAGALPGKRHLDMPREQAFRHGLKVIRDALGDAYFLTCGTPILPSLGLCDGMRIGPDVSGSFSSRRDENLLRNFATPGVQNALRTCLRRLWLRSLVHTDPDVTYFSTRANRLSPAQKELLQDLAQICDFKATSDIPNWLNEQEIAKLEKFLVTRPVISQINADTFRVGDHLVDYQEYIQMPPNPGMFLSLLGRLVGFLANNLGLLRVVDKYYKMKLSSTLKRNPC